MGEHVRIARRSLQEIRGHERVEQRVGGPRLEIPEPPHLRLGELESGHFQVFGFDEMEPVLDRALRRDHVGSFRGFAAL